MTDKNAIASSTVVKSIFINACLAAVKIITGVVGNSYALIADGIESLNDLFSSLVVWCSLRIASRPPSDRYHYGQGKAEQLGALFSAVSLLGAGVVIVIQSVQNIFTRHEAPAWFTLPVLIVVIITKELLSRYALEKSEETLSTSLKGDAWHHRSDAITSAAAFGGILVALIGGPGFEKADDVGALIGCAVIGINGYLLLKTALHENLDGAPPPELLLKVRQVAAAVPEVLGVEKLRMKKMGLGYFMDIHIEVSPVKTVEEGHSIAHAVKDALHSQVPQVNDIVTHVEPYDGPLPEGKTTA
ncbi:cation diffusion facilitator family transporter [Prosthecobacter sp. SYSU 5D2]|uniref:cation diffusion facilitator family transporter n=1 Tax=Prosthecobacter sp. SYSU 5D2 TaxID=3134134 RepID=UPI0031FED2EC